MKSFKLFIAALVTLFVFNTQAQTHSKIKIYANDTDLQRLQQLGIPIDHGAKKQGVWFESDFSSEEIEIIKAEGFNYEIIINDVIKYYQERAFERSNEQDINALATDCDDAAPDYAEPNGFNLGTMGGFYKYAEFIAHLDNMANTYPNLITAKQPIGSFTTHDNNPVYWMRLSDNPTVDENEPEVLYTSLHHAREPESMTQLIYYMYYLLENYGTNDEVTYLVDNVEMYFIPMINPDGYKYNELTNPNGGGLWRKNRRDNGGNEYGVDLNRNYDFHFAYDNIGSSPNPSSNTYRGSSGFSEPETQAIKFFTENRNIEVVMNYHAYGDLLIYPWGYLANIYTPDSAQFVEWSKAMTKENKYTYGTGNQTVGYTVNGDSDDWFYGEQNTKGKVIAYTPEVGSQGDGFWPQVSQIIPLAKENVRQNLNTAHLVLQYAVVQDHSSEVVQQLNGFLSFDVLRLGLDSPSTFTVSITPVSSNMISAGAAKTFTNLSMLEKQLDSISYTLDANISQGETFTYELKIDNSQFTWQDTLTKFYGTKQVLYADSVSNLSNWTTSSWNTTTSTFVSSPTSITDSPFGEYSNNSTTTIQLADSIDLSKSLYASLSFYCKWELETGWDFVQVEASSDKQNWEPLCGLYTKPGNEYQDLGNPIYDGFQFSWVKEEMSLQDFVGGNVYIRYVLESDNWTTEDGFYFDDVEVTSIEEEEVGIKENQLFEATIFPNPTTGDVTISTKEETWSFEIYDAIGKQVLSKQVFQSQEKINLASMKKGVYFLTIKANNQLSTHKIIKQ